MSHIEISMKTSRLIAKWKFLPSAFCIILVFTMATNGFLWSEEGKAKNQKSEQTTTQPPPEAETVASDTEKSPEPEKTESNKTTTDDDFSDLLEKEMKGRPGMEEEKSSWFFQFFKTLLVLGFLLGIFYGVFRIYKFRQSLAISGADVVKILYSYPLMPGRNLQIVQISGRMFFLAVSDAGVQLISEIHDNDYISQIKMDIEKEGKIPRADFLLELTNLIKEKINGFSGKKPSSPPMESPFSNGNLNHSRNNVRGHIDILRNGKNDFYTDASYSNDKGKNEQ